MPKVKNNKRNSSPSSSSAMNRNNSVCRNDNDSNSVNSAKRVRMTSTSIATSSSIKKANTFTCSTNTNNKKTKKDQLEYQDDCNFEISVLETNTTSKNNAPIIIEDNKENTNDESNNDDSNNDESNNDDDDVTMLESTPDDENNKNSTSDTNQNDESTNTQHHTRRNSNRTTRNRSSNKRTATSRSRSSRQDQGVKAVALLKVQIDLLINRAEYEVNVDAYRGMFLQHSDQSQNQGDQGDSGKHHTNDNDDDDDDDDGLNQFTCCFGQLDKLKNFNNNDDDDDKCCTKITKCPCFQRWIEKSMNKKMININKNKSKKSKSTKISKSDEAKNEEQKNAVITENFDALLSMEDSSRNMVYIDIENDAKEQWKPYMKHTGASKDKNSLFNNGHDKEVTTEKIKNQDEKESSVSKAVVDEDSFKVAPQKTNCIGLVDSTNDEVEVLHANRAISFEIKRPDIKCECDYNPLCLATVGGVIDEYITSKICSHSTSSIQLQNELKDFDKEWDLLKHKDDRNHINGDDIQINDSCNQQHEERLSQSKDELINDASASTVKRKGKEEMIEEYLKTFYSLYTGNGVEKLCNKYGHVEVLSASKANDLRQIVNVDSEAVKLHLKQRICNGDANETLQLYSKIEDVNRSLSFKGMIEEKYKQGSFDGSSSSTMDLCQPVGLRNLGATCYLNSQLQCLSRNLLFVQGLLNWSDNSINTHVIGNSKMIGAISKLQTLLAAMAKGPNNIMTTSEFASSLGLVNNEMQDPNEFARLLFDRMHESFQLAATHKETENISNDPGLVDLLPRIFKGVFQYETKCLSCNQISSRSEDFMDLLLPISDIQEVFNGRKGHRKCVTVQDCFDQYLKPEMMNGVNQYYCESCKCKCDAERSISLRQKPLVLNIQLARYSYNFHTGSRTKLTDPVLLPLILNIPHHRHGMEDGMTSYILCAVQNHRGKSALTGHYVAEAMDWVSGCWFEYDDEQVSLMKDGPTSSYTLNDDLKGAKGTSDAYNLFYVQEGRLRDSVKKYLHGNAKGLVRKIDLIRNDAYRSRMEDLEQEQKVEYRMTIRRLAVLKYMLRDKETTPRQGNSYWVDGEIFKRFMTCTDTMDDILRNEKPVLEHKKYLCKHGCLHPRIARCGKLLSSSSFYAYVTLLETERRLLKNESLMKSTFFEDSWGIPDDQIRCNECAKAYQLELGQKLEKFRLIVKLYHDLDPSSDEIEPNTGTGEYFAVARSFVSNFRKFAMKLMKDATSEGKKEVGLDAFELNDLMPWLSDDDYQLRKDMYFIDPTVNEKIVCKHNNCNQLHHKRMTMFVTKETFSDIKALFPRAHPLPVEWFGDQIHQCPLCKKEEECMTNLPMKLMSLAKDISPIARNTDVTNIGEIYYLVHHEEIKRLESIEKMIEKKCPPRKGRENALGRQLHSKITMDHFNDQFKWKSQPLFSQDGMTVIPSETVMLLEEMQSSRSPAAIQSHSSGSISILSEKSYNLYKKFIDSLEMLLFGYDTNHSNDLSQQNSPNKRPDHPKVTFHKGKLEWYPNLCQPTEPLSCQSDLSNSNTQTDQKQTNEKQTESEIPQINDEEVEIIGCKKPNVDTFFYKIHEFGAAHNLYEARSILERHHADANNEASTAQQLSYHDKPRRSSRRRKKNMDTFEMYGGKADSLAHFRLRVNEQSKSADLVHQKLCVFQYDKSSLDESKRSYIYPLDHERNCDEMQDILEKFINDDAQCVEIILYDENGDDIDHIGVRTNDELLQELLQMATSKDGHFLHDTQRSYCRKGRTIERGFQGTFLQSSTLQQPP